jgi:hypothetical protein
MPFRRLSVFVVIMISLGVTTAALAGAAKPTRDDSFRARISAATGRLTGRHGRVQIGFFPVASNTRTRSLLITVTPRPCREAHGCARLRGTLNGSITQVQSIPDTGSAFTITAHGTVRPLGHVTVSGTAHGMGNARFGHETVRLTLTRGDGGGAVTVTGTSGRVPGFSSP